MQRVILMSLSSRVSLLLLGLNKNNKFYHLINVGIVQFVYLYMNTSRLLNFHQKLESYGIKGLKTNRCVT